jgi:hypothetical protein
LFAGKVRSQLYSGEHERRIMFVKKEKLLPIVPQLLYGREKKVFLSKKMTDKKLLFVNRAVSLL